MDAAKHLPAAAAPAPVTAAAGPQGAPQPPPLPQPAAYPMSMMQAAEAQPAMAHPPQMQMQYHHPYPVAAAQPDYTNAGPMNMLPPHFGQAAQPYGQYGQPAFYAQQYTPYAPLQMAPPPQMMPQPAMWHQPQPAWTQPQQAAWPAAPMPTAMMPQPVPMMPPAAAAAGGIAAPTTSANAVLASGALPVGSLVAMAQEQEGSRLLQQQLSTMHPEQLSAAVEELAPHLATLATNAFGNYLAAAQEAIFHALQGHVCRLMQHPQGSRVCQAAVERLPAKSAQVLVEDLRGHVP